MTAAASNGAAAQVFPLVIKASSRTQVEALISDLSSDRPVTRESAITRLTLIGSRAIDRVLTITRDRAGSSTARTAALRVLEALQDARTLDAILDTIADDDPAVAAAAASASRGFLRGPRGAAVADRLTSTALNRQRADSIRVAALEALALLDAATLKPLYRALADDPNEAIKHAGASAGGDKGHRHDRERWLPSAAEASLPDDPAAVRRAVTSTAGTLPLSRLHRLVEQITERERSAPSRQSDWMIVRAAVHAALAARRSRIALYDLRETVAAAKEPLPVEFLTALGAIGDAGCLEAIAPAYAAATDEWWRAHLADTFRTIVTRERLTSRHAVMRRVKKRWPAVFPELCQ